MTIKTKTSAFPVSERLVQLLTSALCEAGDYPHRSVTLNFRDPDYSAERGGYRPVEIRVNDDGEIVYITEFTYFGQGAFAELSKATDFDFGERTYRNEYRTYVITDRGVEEFYRLWESNFCAYIEMDVFKVQVSAEEFMS